MPDVSFGMQGAPAAAAAAVDSRSKSAVARSVKFVMKCRRRKAGREEGKKERDRENSSSHGLVN